MKTITLASTLVFGAALGAGAQGVLLLPGQNLSIEFSGVDACQSFEPSYAGGSVVIVFGNDILAPGERLLLEMFEDNLNEPSLAFQFYSPATPVVNAVLGSPGAWLDYQGVIRVSMFSGSVDLSYAHFFVRPDPFTYCDTVVLVPEPPTILLLALSGILPAACFGCGYARSRRIHHCASVVPQRY